MLLDRMTRNTSDDSAVTAINPLTLHIHASYEPCLWDASRCIMTGIWMITWGAALFAHQLLLMIMQYPFTAMAFACVLLCSMWTVDAAGVARLDERDLSCVALPERLSEWNELPRTAEAYCCTCGCAIAVAFADCRLVSLSYSQSCNVCSWCMAALRQCIPI
jgi:hypothetical protein